MKDIIKTSIFSARNAVYNTLAAFSRPRASAYIVVLCYHSVGNDDWKFSISSAMIKKQLLYLMKTHTPLSAEDVVAFTDGFLKLDKPGFLVTFDDGYQNVTELTDFMSHHSIRPLLFVLADDKNANRKELNNTLQFLTDDEIKNLHKINWTIGCHSKTHTDFSRLTSDQLKEEIIMAKRMLEERLNITVNYFSYPKGFYNEKIVDAVGSSWYDLAFSMDDGVITVSSSRLCLPRIGVDASHGMKEFRALFSPAVMKFKNILKNTPVKQFFVS